MGASPAIQAGEHPSQDPQSRTLLRGWAACVSVPPQDVRGTREGGSCSKLSLIQPGGCSRPRWTDHGQQEKYLVVSKTERQYKEGKQLCNRETSHASSVEEWISPCLSSCSRSDRPLVELSVEPVGFSGRCTGPRPRGCSGLGEPRPALPSF